MIWCSARQDGQEGGTNDPTAAPEALMRGPQKKGSWPDPVHGAMPPVLLFRHPIRQELGFGLVAQWTPERAVCLTDQKCVTVHQVLSS